MFTIHLYTQPKDNFYNILNKFMHETNLYTLNHQKAKVSGVGFSCSGMVLVALKKFWILEHFRFGIFLIRPGLSTLRGPSKLGPLHPTSSHRWNSCGSAAHYFAQKMKNSSILSCFHHIMIKQASSQGYKAGSTYTYL